MCSPISHLMSMTALSLRAYSTSLCRLTQWIFLCMDYECIFVQALVLVLDLVHPQCAAAYMCGNLGLTLKIYLYFIINEQKKSEWQLHIWVQWQKESSTIYSQHCCLSLPAQPPQGKYNSFFGPRKRSPGWPLAKKTFVVFSFPSVCWEQLHHGMGSEEREGSIHKMSTSFSSSK